MAGTLLDLLGLTDPAAALIAASTGGSIAPVGATGAQTQAESADNGTGGAAAPAAGAPAAAPDPFASLVALLGKKRGQAVAPALQARGQTLDAKAPDAVKSAADRWGGKVLGFGKTPGKGKFATVFRNGELFHVYADPRKNQKMDTGGVAEALGIKPKVGGLVRVPGGNGSGGMRAPGGNGAGGLQGPGGRMPRLSAGAQALQGGPGAGQDPSSVGMSNGPALSEQHRVPLDPLTGGVLAPEADGMAQAASATVGDVPLTAAEAYRRRLLAGRAQLGL